MVGEIEPQQISVRINNDVVITATLTDPNLPLIGGKQQPLDLTGKTCTLVRKLSRDVPDTDPSFDSYAGTNQAPFSAGICTFAVPHVDLTVAAVTWWRLDVTSAGKTVTAQFGPFVVDPT
jgi:hypothetical protein